MARFTLGITRLVCSKRVRYDVLLDGQVQITGAMFDNNKRQYGRAIARLNRAIEAGQDSAVVQAHDGNRDWTMKYHNQGYDVLPVNLHPGVARQPSLQPQRKAPQPRDFAPRCGFSPPPARIC